MRIALILIVFLVYTVARDSYSEATPVTERSGSATASKDVKDAIKAAKEAKKAKKECLKACPANYDPICVHDPNDVSFKPRTFGSQCVLDTHNCEAGTKLVTKSKGECPGSDGVRL